MTVNAKSQIRTVDLSAFTQGGSDLKAKRAAAANLAGGCHEYGVVAIINHGLPLSILNETFGLMKRLFDLPMEDKMKAPHPDGFIPHRGYSPPGREKCFSEEDLQSNDEQRRAAAKQVVDYKEHYEVGSEENKVHGNIWLPESVLPGFKEYTTKLYWDLHTASMTILDALMMGLDLSEKESIYVRKIHTGHCNQLRLLHYPKIPASKVNSEMLGRFPPHCDWSTFTLLFQDACGGLEFADREGNFMPAVPAEDKVYLNVGDMLMILSNNIFPSAKHRVTIPETRVKSGPEKSLTTLPRYSMPYFVLPEDNDIIEPQASCVSPDRPAQYPKVTLATYQDEKAKWIYSK